MHPLIHLAAPWLGLLVLLWLAFSLGTYMQWRRSIAFGVNQILIVRQMVVRGDQPEQIIAQAGWLASTLEQGVMRSSFFDLLDPALLPGLLSSKGEEAIWEQNSHFPQEDTDEPSTDFAE